MHKNLKKAYLPILSLLFCALAAFAVFFAACGKDVKEYTFHFETNGGSPVEDIVAEEGAQITAPQNPARSGYEFDGWYLSADFTGEKQSIPATMPAEDRTYYAHWLAVMQYSVNVYLQDFATGDYNQSQSLSKSGTATEGTVVKATSSDMTVEGYTLNSELSTTQITMGARNTIELYFDVNYVGYIDVLSGEDVIYTTADAAYLERIGFEGYKKSLNYNPATGAFLFGEGNGVQLSGKITDAGFFWYKDIWNKTYNGSSAGETLTLAEDGVATYTKDGATQNGTFFVDGYTSYFTFESDGEQTLFDLNVEENTFRFCGEDFGWYALKKADNTLGYGLLFIDGFGGYMLYAKSPDDPEFNFLTDIAMGQYKVDGGVYMADETPLKLTQTTGDILDSFDLNGYYVVGNYRGDYTSSDAGKTEQLYLDGFGAGTFDGSAITYELNTESWNEFDGTNVLLNSYNNVTFTHDGTNYNFTIFDGKYYAVTSPLYGRAEFDKNALPVAIYGDGLSANVAFLYFYGYPLADLAEGIEGALVDIAELWVGFDDPADFTGIPEEVFPIYAYWDMGAVTSLGGDNYRYESVDGWFVSFDFTVSEGKVDWKVSEDRIDFTTPDEDGYIYLDEHGIAYLQNEGFDPVEITYISTPALYGDLGVLSSIEDGDIASTLEYMASLYEFDIGGGETQSFILLHDSTVKPIKRRLSVYQSNVEVLWFEDNTSISGLDLSVADPELNAMLYCVEGTITQPGGYGADEYQLTATKSSPDENIQSVYDSYANFRFKTEQGSDVVRRFNEETKIEATSPSLGSLNFDGYGHANITWNTAAGMRNVVNGEYSLTDGTAGTYYVSYQYEGSSGTAMDDYYIIVTKSPAGGTGPTINTFTLAGGEAGVFMLYGLTDADQMQNNILTVDGGGNVFGFIDYDEDGDGDEFIGKYTAVETDLDLNNSDAAYELTITVDSSCSDIFGQTLVLAVAKFEDEILGMYGVGGINLGLFYLKNEYGTGDYIVVDGEGNSQNAYLSGDGYADWNYVSAATYEQGIFYRGNFGNSYITDEDGTPDFTRDPNGKSIVFTGSYTEYVFDIYYENGSPKIIQVDGEDHIAVTLRTLDYGSFRLYDKMEFSDRYIVLDGYGTATIYSAAGDTKIEEGAYSLTDADMGVYTYTSDSGTFNFQTSYLYDENAADPAKNYVCSYIVYDGVDGVYTSSDWEVLILTGFGDAAFGDKYGGFNDEYLYYLASDTEVVVLDAQANETRYVINPQTKTFTHKV